MYISEHNSPSYIGQSQTKAKRISENKLNPVPAIGAENSNKTNNNVINCNNNNDNIINTNCEEITSNREYCGFGASIIDIRDSDNSFSNKKSTNVAKTKSNKKDIYMVAEGYHKTDSCYYKTPDGGYHKLPPDSYHKMSEICYNKLPDGSFKRLVDKQNVDSSNTGINASVDVANTGSQNKVRNNMIKFLKRSKSHSQATAKETYISYRKENNQISVKGKGHYQEAIKNNNIALQKSVLDHGNIGTKASTYSNNSNSTGPRNSTYSGSRKVVVTMMENGGLPIVATSISKSSKNEYKPHHQNSIRDKVKLNIILFRILNCNVLDVTVEPDKGVLAKIFNDRKDVICSYKFNMNYITTTPMTRVRRDSSIFEFFHVYQALHSSSRVFFSHRYPM